MTIQSAVSGERCFVLQVADRLAYVPGLGTAIGAIRIAASIAALAVAFFVHAFAPAAVSDKIRESMEGVSNIAAIRALGELRRGLTELIPFASLICDAKSLDGRCDPDAEERSHGRFFSIGQDGHACYTYKENALAKV